MLDRLKNRQVADVLEIDEKELRVLQNHGRPEYLIPRTYGTGSRDAAWSPADVLRLALVARVDERRVLAPHGRKKVWDAVTREMADELLCGRGPRYLVSDGFTFVAAQSLDSLREADAEDGWIGALGEREAALAELDLDGEICLLDLHRLAADIRRQLDTLTESAEGDGEEGA